MQRTPAGIVGVVSLCLVMLACQPPPITPDTLRSLLPTPAPDTPVPSAGEKPIDPYAAWACPPAGPSWSSGTSIGQAIVIPTGIRVPGVAGDLAPAGLFTIQSEVGSSTYGSGIYGLAVASSAARDAVGPIPDVNNYRWIVLEQPAMGAYFVYQVVMSAEGYPTDELMRREGAPCVVPADEGILIEYHGEAYVLNPGRWIAYDWSALEGPTYRSCDSDGYRCE